LNMTKLGFITLLTLCLIASTFAKSKSSQSTLSSNTTSYVSEVHCDVEADEESQFVTALGLKDQEVDVETIYFYDTSNLDLFNAGLLIRTRV